jgi:acetylornithine/succinyldiaminopimelate/putrescine aminotransferase
VISAQLMIAAPRLIFVCLVANLELVGIEGKFKGKSAGTLSVGMKNTTPGEVKSVIEDTQNILAARGFTSADAASNTNTLSSAIEMVMSKLEIIVQIGDEVSTVRTIASISNFRLTWLEDQSLC